MPGPDEFETVARLLAPLAGPEALGLTDDAAAVPSRAGHDLVITKDAIVEGVHFLPNDPLDLVARKLLRVNLSDLAAKGAEPYGYFLACAWPDRVDWAGRELFAEGLAEDQQIFGLYLLGGDTVSTPGPLTLSCTMLGWVSSGAMVRRSGARPGDLVQVTGTIGDGWLGLMAAQGQLDAPELLRRYQLPEPRIGADLSQATACADVSDGLLADARHIADASAVRIVIDLAKLPLSPGARARAQDDAKVLAQLATGGDDYELVATGPRILPGFTVVGEVREGAGVLATYRGETVDIPKLGWRHGNQA